MTLSIEAFKDLYLAENQNEDAEIETEAAEEKEVNYKFDLRFAVPGCLYSEGINNHPKENRHLSSTSIFI